MDLLGRPFLQELRRNLNSKILRKKKDETPRLVLQEQIADLLLTAIWARPLSGISSLNGFAGDIYCLTRPAESPTRYKVAFTIEHGELTPTLKIKRNKVSENWAKEIDALYAEDAEARSLS